jgi:hypothetical protein
LREFDYFSLDQEPEPEAAEDLPAGLDEQIAAFRALQKRRFRVLVLACVALAAAVWFLWGYRDEAVYAFATPEQPLELGDVTRVSPGDLAHNTFVSLHGITEHRGLTQKTVRGLGIARNEHWYFRLLGSRGVFIEVEPDPERWGFTTEVFVAGRVVDPSRVLAYRSLLDSYGALYHPQERPQRRLIQVGVVPGEGRAPYLVAAGLFVGLLALNAWAVVAIARGRRDAARRGIVRG